MFEESDTAAVVLHEPHRIAELDGLRGMAILLVLFQHYAVGPMGDRLGLLAVPGRMAWTGVDLFFVLSGFLLGGVLLENRESSTYFRTFYLRRAFRIVPLYLVLVFATYFFHAELWHTARPSLWLYLTFTQNFWMAAAGTLGTIPLAVTWSLAIEEQFYVALPALVRFTRPDRLWRTLLACILLAPLLRLALALTHGSAATIASHVLLFTRLDALGLGVLLAWMRHRGVSIRPAHLWLTAAVALAGGAIMAAGSSTVGLTPVVALLYTAVAVFYGVILLLALNGKLPFLRNRFLTSTGVISYAIYLFHQPVAFLLRGGDMSVRSRGDMLLMVVAFVLVWILAAASWHVLEKPLIRRGHRFVYRPRSPQSADPDMLNGVASS